MFRLAATAAAIAALFGSSSARAAELTVDVGHPGHAVSPTLWGIFFEEINHAGDGGIYAELVRNRGFEESDGLVGWTVISEGGGTARAEVDAARPLNTATPHSLRLTVAAPSGGSGGVANTGYWGIPVRRGATYTVSLFARSGARGPEALDVSLESAGGAVYARTRLDGLTGDWKRFTSFLVADASDPAARLAMRAVGSGTVWLDVVSLFPETYRERPNGLRPDLARMLADLKPSFVRFPGGCYVEGDQLVNAFRWKNSVGDIADRPGHWNLWGYRSTDGLGYHEYLQMCEDIGAEPVFVVNCGMAHGGVVPMDQMDEWVQDALDAVEYANGPTTSRWGALRASNGHPEPFGLKCLEIGNENGGPAYEDRYALFRKALKGRHPDVRLIADVPVRSAPMEIVDEHYYSNPDWFASQTHHYDSYDRSGPRIYVGEYAVTERCGQGNLRAALGEAAFMTGIERNSDIVVMASYAPLFVNASNRAWNPDAICFDSAASYGTPSYHVQRMFSENRPERTLPTTLVCDAPGARPHGAIGLGTWATQSEYKDIRVTSAGRTLYASDFTRDATEWRVVRGDWSTSEGAFRQSSTDVDIRATAGDPRWTDYTLSLKARKLGGAEGFLIMFHVRDDANWLWWNIGGWGNVRHAIEKSSVGAKTTIGPSVAGSVETGRWYDIRVEVDGERIRCYLDGKLVHDVEDPGPSAMAACAGLTGDEVIVKVANTSDQPQGTEVRLDGVTSVEPMAKATVLTSGSAGDENSLAQPTRVAPVVGTATGVSSRFGYTFPPYSLTILRVHCGR